MTTDQKRIAARRDESYIDGWRDREFVNVNRSHLAASPDDYDRGWGDADDGKEMPENLAILEIRN